MKTWGFVLSLIVSLTGVVPVSAQVRSAELSGSATDESGAVLPGVTVTATHIATKQMRTTVTQADGAYLLTALPVGVYEVRAELQGFKPTVYSNLRLEIGDSIKLDVRLKVAGMQESVTVGAEVPLVDTSKSDISGKINQSQVEELPVSGRNWLYFAMLAPGVKSEGGDAPSAGLGTGRIGTKVFVDGASVQTFSTVAIQTEVSKDIIGEFEVLTNRFDAQFGHSGAAIVNAVTKSGTDVFSGSAFYYLRDDKLNAKDFFANRVLPFQNKQWGGTIGGPLVRGRMQFFGNYERQVQPQTVASNTGISSLDVPIDATPIKNMSFGRVDYSITQNHRVSARLNYYDLLTPYSGAGGTVSPANSSNFDITTYRWNGDLNSVFGSRFVNQLLVNYLDSQQHFNRIGCGWNPTLTDCPTYSFPSVQIGPRTNVGYELHNWLLLRDDASYFLEKKGQHNIKFGGEATAGQVFIFFPNATNGLFFYNQNPPNLATCCPGADQSKWDKSQFPIPARYQVGLGDFSTTAPNHIYSAYLQDDWKLNKKLTLNLGVRYDVEFGSLANDQLGLTVKPHGNDVDNLQPRMGFAWDVTGKSKTVVRGGAGTNYDQVYLNLTYNQLLQNSGKNVSVTIFNTNNDPNFANDPLGGRGFDQLKGLAGATNVARLADNAEQPHMTSAAIGVAQQITSDLAVTIDYVYERSHAMYRSLDQNLFCCLPNGNAIPIKSGVYPELGGSVQGAGRPDPRFNAINTYVFTGRARYDGLQIALNKRMSKRYQFGITYLLSKNEDDGTSANNMFNPEDEYGTAAIDERHRIVANWVSLLPHKLNVNGIVYYASGRAFGISTGGVDINGDGSTSGDRPICGLDPRFNPGCTALGIPNGVRVSRNPGRSDPVLRFDLRVSRTFAFGRTKVDPLVEAFNLFNRQNNDPTTYNISLANPHYGQPGPSTSLQYQPRQIQVGVRLTF